MSLLTEYTAFLARLGLRHFSPSEITDYASEERWHSGLGRTVTNSLPPRDLWHNIIPTLWLLDNLRAGLGKPIVLTSIYRNELYNQAVGGGLQSQHKLNKAVDFQVVGMSPHTVRDRLLTARQAGVWRGGLGRYGTFTHVDTRSTNATWG